PARFTNSRPLSSPTSITRSVPERSRRIAARGSAGRSKCRASPLPDPAGITPSGTGPNASAVATSFTVPSPPQATTRRAPRSTAPAASSRAWPACAVIRISGSAPAASSRSEAWSARRRVRSRLLRTPAMGLRMIATRTPGTISGRHPPQHPRRGEPHQSARPTGWHAVDVDPADGSLAEFQRPLQAEQPDCEVADIGLVPDERDARALGDAPHFRDDGGVDGARRERIDRLRARPARQAGGEQLRRLTATHERAGQDQIDLDSEGGHAGHSLAKLLRTVGRQRAHPIVRPVRAALSSGGVAHEVQLEIAGNGHAWRRAVLAWLTPD